MLALILFMMPVFGPASAAADVSGTWQLALKAGWTSIPALVCTLSQKGTDVTGACRAADETEERRVDLTGGKVDGNTISCQWKIVTPNGETWTYALTGTLDEKATTMNGTFKLSGPFGGGKGSFTGTKRSADAR